MAGEQDLEFKLFDAPSEGNQQGVTVMLENVAVANGPFTVALDLVGACGTPDRGLRGASSFRFTRSELFVGMGPKPEKNRQVPKSVGDSETIPSASSCG